ncbi:MAG: hypothetical protein H7Z21_17320 [Hymenobacter sp.]|nr:hypothetical protein [Hymenobacter sp.]
MRLSWPDIRRNAYAFSNRWKNEKIEQAGSQSFWDEFFRVFGNDRLRVATFEHRVTKQRPTLPAGQVAEPEVALGRGRIDLFWPGELLVESKSRGKDLDRAYEQALEYVAGLPAYERPPFVIVSDFARLRRYDLRGRTTFPAAADHLEVPLAELGQHVRAFGFMAGYLAHTY